MDVWTANRTPEDESVWRQDSPKSAQSLSSAMTSWNIDFLNPKAIAEDHRKRALIILNQPCSRNLLERLWEASHWHCCADGGANRLHDAFDKEEDKARFLPDLIKGDFDSVRKDTHDYYSSKGVQMMKDSDEYSTDLMKCVDELTAKENLEGSQQWDLIILGGLSGRLDQTIHTLSYLHKLRIVRSRVFVVTDDSVAWVLDGGEHSIIVDHSTFGPTCGLLPIGVDETILSTKGLRWNLNAQRSSFDGLISTSNHLLPTEPTVWIDTSRPIFWTMELRYN